MVHKTISIQYKPTKTERHLFEFLTRESKHVYNITIFCYKFIDMFKSRIYKELHDYITDFVKIKKNIKKSSIETINAKLYEVINKKYEYYMSIKEQKQVNNDLIYQHIIKSIKDNNFTVTNNNYFQLVEHYIKELEPLVKTDKINKFDLLDNIVTNLLKSIYIKNFYHVKYAMINHTALKITNSVFINQVKKNEFLFKNKDINWKTKIETDFQPFKEKIDVIKIFTSDRNILSRITLEKTSEKLSVDIKEETITKAYLAIDSYFKKKLKGLKSNFPSYLPFDSYYNIYFYKSSMKEIKMNNKYKIRLALGNYISKNYMDITHNNSLVSLNDEEKDVHKKYIDTKYLMNIPSNKIYKAKRKGYCVNGTYISKKDNHILNSYYLNIPFPNLNRDENSKEQIPKYKDLSFVELIPDYDGTFFRVNYVYNNGIEKIEEKEEEDEEDEEDEEEQIGEHKEEKEGKENEKPDIIPEDCISIDTGMINLLTIYDPTGKCYIIKGTKILNLNHYYNNLIDKIKSDIKKKHNVYTSKKIRQLLIDRMNKIDNYFNHIVSKVYELYKDKKKKIIIGYNLNWKNGVNMGKEMNRKFYGIPYRKLIDKFKNKFNDREEIVVEREESFTSKCDALAFEPIERQLNYSGKRIKRGLFESKNGKLLNADINGAINIMRKYFRQKGIIMKDKISGEIFNPIILKI